MGQCPRCLPIIMAAIEMKSGIVDVEILRLVFLREEMAQTKGKIVRFSSAAPAN
jgi:hypothetical protein